jgi:hypothetical protein
MTLTALRFRWVECQLMTLSRCRSLEDLEDALKGLPKDLDATYDRMLDNIREEDRKRAKCILQLIAVARRPLTVHEVNEALTVDCEEETIYPKRRMQDPFEILEICSGLLELYRYAYNYVFETDVFRSTEDEVDEETHEETAEETLRFAHFSVKEFLVSSRLSRSILPSSFFAIYEPDAHRFATIVCLIYVISAVETSAFTPKQFPLIQYAARYWYIHVTGTISEIRESLEYNLVIKLFDFPRFRRWLSLYHLDKNEFVPPLLSSALFGLVNVTTVLLEKGANVNASGGLYGSPLQAASWKGHQEIVALLMEKGADVNAAGGLYGSPLQAASLNGHQEIVALLMEKGANVNASGGLNGSPLQAASWNGHQEIVALLMEKGANINAVGGHYGSALQAALLNGHQEIVALLLDKGADVNASGGLYGSALQIASFKGHQEIVALLLEKGAVYP